MKNSLKLVVLSFALVTAANVAAAQMPVQTVAPVPASVTYPIAELGGCTDKKACHVYCESTDHIVACAQFAANHGMISQEQANKAKEFKDALASGGPGGCKDQNSCAAYCEDIAHADTCLAFAETHKLLPTKELEQAKKVAKALRNGGQTPGACKDKSSCEAYCADTSHFDECIAFAEKANLMSKEDAAIARKAGGVGPGGCTSKEACNAYCNASENAPACLAFAKEKGILSSDKIKEIEDGMGRLRTGIKQMPSEMVSCLTDALGADTVTQLEAGTLTPGPDIGTKVKACADSFAPKLKEKMDAAFGMATPQVLACLETALGKDRVTQIKGGATPSASEGGQVRKCFESIRAEGLKQAQNGLDKMPPQMRTCIEAKLGAETLAKIQAGDTEALGPESAKIFRDCAASMQKNAGDDVRAYPQEGTSSSGEGRAPAGIPMKVPPAAGIAPAVQGPSCDAFVSVPSCDMVPESVRAICRSCKK